MVMQWPAVGMSNQKGESHVVDDRCHTVGSLAVGPGVRLYVRLCYSYSACHCNRCGSDWPPSGAKIRISDLGNQSSICTKSHRYWPPDRRYFRFDDFTGTPISLNP